ncbi:MAG: hypothetical protein ACUVRS_10920 [Armatimonadota bacterium]
MKRLTMVLTILLLTGPIAVAQDEKPPMDLPIYPGGSTVTEVNVTGEELANLIQALLPILGEKFGPVAQVVNSDELTEIIRDIKRIQYMESHISKASVTHEQVANFYSKKLPSGQWSRILWLANESNVLALYAQNNMEQLYGFRSSDDQQDGKTIRKAQVVKIEGKIDYVKAVKLVGKVFASSVSLQ